MTLIHRLEREQEQWDGGMRVMFAQWKEGIKGEAYFRAKNA